MVKSVFFVRFDKIFVFFVFLLFFELNFINILFNILFDIFVSNNLFFILINVVIIIFFLFGKIIRRIIKIINNIIVLYVS